jgi:hypothetical protein
MASEWPTFSGQPRESAADYMEEIQANIDIAKIKDVVLAARVTRSKFRSGLRDEAREWYMREFTGDKNSFDEIRAAFLKRFPEFIPYTPNAMMTEVAGFARRSREPLQTFLVRARALDKKVTEDHIRHVLASRMLTHMGDGERDRVLQMRVVDRLIAKGSVVTERGRDRLADTATFRDVHGTIEACAFSSGPVGWSASPEKTSLSTREGGQDSDGHRTGEDGPTVGSRTQRRNYTLSSKASRVSPALGYGMGGNQDSQPTDVTVGDAIACSVIAVAVSGLRPDCPAMESRRATTPP